MKILGLFFNEILKCMWSNHVTFVVEKCLNAYTMYMYMYLPWELHCRPTYSTSVIIVHVLYAFWNRSYLIMSLWPYTCIQFYCLVSHTVECGSPVNINCGKPFIVKLQTICKRGFCFIHGYMSENANHAACGYCYYNDV